VFREIARPVLHYLGVHPDTDRTVMVWDGAPRTACIQPTDPVAGVPS